MVITIPNVLSLEQVNFFRDRLNHAPWQDGLITAGYQGAQVKKNLQLSEHGEIARELGNLILIALEKHPTFISATLPNQVYPPLFNLYGEGQTFGYHIDNAVRLHPQTGVKFRTDVSCTLFLSDPEEYDGGELCIADTYGTQHIKLPAGDMVIYPATSVHQVSQVTQGVRLASFFWIQSLIRSDEQRRLLYELDQSIQALTISGTDQTELIRLTGVYHNLLRFWSET